MVHKTCALIFLKAYGSWVTEVQVTVYWENLNIYVHKKSNV